MAEIIHELQHEHKNFQQLIGLMNEQFNLFRNNSGSDCVWLLDAAVLIRCYQRAVHQPAEDIFLEKLLAHSGKASALLKPLLYQDRQVFTDYSRDFIDALDSVIHGAVVPRETLVMLGEKTLQGLSRQMTFEEHAVFPFAERLLDEDDWREIDREIHCRHNADLERRLRLEYRSLKKRAGLLPH